MTASIYRPGGVQQELAQGKTIADEALAAGAKLLIWSTVPSPMKISEGKYPVKTFDNKDEVKDYIESLSIRSAFFALGTFMQNFHGMMGPRPAQDGTFAIYNFVSPSTAYALVDITDTGKYVAAILDEPQKYAGKTFCAATRLYTVLEITEIMSRVTGKTISYVQVSKDVFTNFLPEHGRNTLLNMFLYFQDFGYFGKDTKPLVAWAVSNARGRPTALEDYLNREPLKL